MLKFMRVREKLYEIWHFHNSRDGRIAVERLRK